MSGPMLALLVGLALCCGVMFGVLLAMFVGYSYARTQTQATEAEEQAAIDEITARIAQEYINRSTKKVDTA